jgi:hypothetical protein
LFSWPLPLLRRYELAADYSTLLLQYKHAGDGCQPRGYAVPDNGTRFSASLYNLETGFLEMLLQSGHRTLDPEEAGGLPWGRERCKSRKEIGG